MSRAPLTPLVLGSSALVAVLALGWWLSTRAEPPCVATLPTPLITAVETTPAPAGPPRSERVPPAEEIAEPPSMGCGTEPPFIGTSHIRDPRSLGGAQWLTHIPTGYDPAAAHPVVIVLHQTNETPHALFDLTGFAELADRDQWVVIAPSSNITGPWKNGSADLRRIREILDETSDLLCLDLERVYVVGHGAGGRPALKLSCEAWVAGVATNSFRPGVDETFCHRPDPIPYLMLSPTKSRREPIDGSASCDGDLGASVHDLEERWRRRNRCAPAAAAAFTHKRSRCRSWDCYAPFESCHVDGGHGWPGSAKRPFMDECDGDAPDFPTGPRIWDFFRAASEHSATPD